MYDRKKFEKLKLIEILDKVSKKCAGPPANRRAMTEIFRVHRAVRRGAAVGFLIWIRCCEKSPCALWELPVNRMSSAGSCGHVKKKSSDDVREMVDVLPCNPWSFIFSGILIMIQI
jgi:hypothetical protein